MSDFSFSSEEEEDDAAEDVDSDILFEDHLEDEHLKLKSSEPQQGPDCPGLNMSDNNGPTDNPDHLDQLEIPEPQQGPDCPGLNMSDNSGSTGNPFSLFQQPLKELEEKMESTQSYHTRGRMGQWESGLWSAYRDRPWFAYPPLNYTESSSPSIMAVPPFIHTPIQPHDPNALRVMKVEEEKKRTSDSDESTASSVSLRSDDSKRESINFKGWLSPRVSRRRKASSGSSCASIKSKGSLGYIKAKKRCSGSDVSFPSSSPSEEEDVAADDVDNKLTSDSGVSTASSASFKSDRSKDKVINFKGQPLSRVKKENEELRLENKRLDKELQELRRENKRVWKSNEWLMRVWKENEKLHLKNERLWKENEKLRLKNERNSDSDESTASSVSFKSDRSKDKVIKFKGQLSPRSDVSPPPLPHQKRRMLQQMMLTINRKMTSRPADE